MPGAAITIEEPALRAALAAGLRFWGMATGTSTAAMSDELVAQQIAAIRRHAAAATPNPAPAPPRLHAAAAPKRGSWMPYKDTDE